MTVYRFNYVEKVANVNIVGSYPYLRKKLILAFLKHIFTSNYIVRKLMNLFH